MSAKPPAFALPLEKADLRESIRSMVTGAKNRRDEVFFHASTNFYDSCYARFRNCVEKEQQPSKCILEFMPGTNHRNTWGPKSDDDYYADFLLISRRTLTPEEYRIFYYHVLLGADWKLCGLKLKIDLSSFIHAIYRIQQALDSAFEIYMRRSKHDCGSFQSSPSSLRLVRIPISTPRLSAFGSRNSADAFLTDVRANPSVHTIAPILPTLSHQ